MDDDPSVRHVDFDHRQTQLAVSRGHARKVEVHRHFPSGAEFVHLQITKLCVLYVEATSRQDRRPGFRTISMAGRAYSYSRLSMS
jgi:hypothetical protein